MAHIFGMPPSCSRCDSRIEVQLVTGRGQPAGFFCTDHGQERLREIRGEEVRADKRREGAVNRVISAKARTHRALIKEAAEVLEEVMGTDPQMAGHDATMESAERVLALLKEALL